MIDINKFSGQGDDSPPASNNLNELCIYHANCLDGFASAWVVKQALPDCVFHPGIYNDPPPDVTELDVVLVDFSYKREVILEMAKVANSITIIDHHKTAIENLVDLPENVRLIVNLNKSGCILTWEYFFGTTTEEPPPLLRHIQDRDLWQFKLPNTNLITLALSSYDCDFDVWSDIINTVGIGTLVNEGKTLNRKYQKDLYSLIELTKRNLWIGGQTVPAANVSHQYASDVGNIMVQETLGAAFAATYYDTAEWRIFSLRSVDGGMDVSEVAKLYGGGGHKHAAGFRVTRYQAQDFEIAL